MENIEQEKLIKTLQIDGRESIVYESYSNSSELAEYFRQQISTPRRA